jgi:hypothetical protein
MRRSGINFFARILKRIILQNLPVGELKTEFGCEGPLVNHQNRPPRKFFISGNSPLGFTRDISQKVLAYRQGHAIGRNSYHNAVQQKAVFLRVSRIWRTIDPFLLKSFARFH